VKVTSVVGARPQFVKLAPITRAFDATEHEHNVIHTGQHYDGLMSDIFFSTFGLAEPMWNLGVGSGPHGEQTAKMLSGIEKILTSERPDWLLVYGDTNSTLAAALAGAKLHIPVAHLEAGLRSFNRSMPEEHNRVLTDHAADLLLAPTRTAASHLANEGLGARTVVVGDVMVDVLLQVATAVAGRALPDAIDVPDGRFVLATMHRAENTDDPARLAAALSGLAEISIPVILPVHPRLQAAATSADLDLSAGSLHPVEPLGYEQMVRAVLGSTAVITDSGGLQKEAFVLGKTVTTIRTETEWVETLDDGWNVLAPDLKDLDAIVLRPAPTTERGHPYGTGEAAIAAVNALVAHHRSTSSA
jgi:UDP-N-acetylglucosamine 2-epimerase (non-hydrolysing)